MKRPLKAREVAFVLLPALGLGAFAWYQTRVEQVKVPRRANGIFVSHVQLRTAKSRFRAMGLSHEMKVTIGCSSPYPSWWGGFRGQSGINPLRSNVFNEPIGGVPIQRVLTYGAVLTTTAMVNGKPVLKTQWRDTRIGAPMIDNQLVFSHEMALNKIPASAGEVTFRALYLIGEQAPLRITRIVRKAGEILLLDRDQNPHTPALRSPP